MISLYHSLKYPENGYVLRDSIFGEENEPYDWKGDHPLTNYVSLYSYLTLNGFIVEFLSEPLTCFNSEEYGSLLLIDTEKRFSKDEILKL